jgi:amino acid permease
MNSSPSFDDIIERERGLRRTLSARRMTMIAIGGAIGTGLFLGSGFAISLACTSGFPRFRDGSGSWDFPRC